MEQDEKNNTILDLCKLFNKSIKDFEEDIRILEKLIQKLINKNQLYE